MAFSRDRFQHLYNFTPHFLDRKGLKLHYIDEGVGDPVVLVHGNPSWSFMYRKLARELSSNYRVIVPDHIGCGLSSKPTDNTYSYTLENRIQDLSALIKETGAMKDLTLVVHDWGGLIGLGYACRNLESIKRLVILNTAGFLLPEGKSLHWTIRFSRNSWIAAFFIRRFNAFAVLASYLGCLENRMSKELREAYTSPYDSWNNRIGILRFVQDIPLSPDDPSWNTIAEVDAKLEKLAGLPILLCWGEKDFVFDSTFRDEWIRRFPCAERHLFPNAGHYVLEDCSDQIVPLVVDFLDRHPLKVGQG